MILIISIQIKLTDANVTIRRKKHNKKIILIITVIIIIIRLNKRENEILDKE